MRACIRTLQLTTSPGLPHDWIRRAKNKQIKPNISPYPYQRRGALQLHRSSRVPCRPRILTSLSAAPTACPTPASSPLAEWALRGALLASPRGPFCHFGWTIPLQFMTLCLLLHATALVYCIDRCGLHNQNLIPPPGTPPPPPCGRKLHPLISHSCCSRSFASASILRTPLSRAYTALHRPLQSTFTVRSTPRVRELVMLVYTGRQGLPKHQSCSTLPVQTPWQWA